MSNLLQIFAIFAPMLLLLWWTNIAEKDYQDSRVDSSMQRVSLAFMFSLYLLLFLAGLVLHAGFVMMQQQPQLADQVAQLGFDPTRFESFSLVAIGIWLPSLIGIMLLRPSIRIQLARLIPIDPFSPLQAISLALMMLIVGNMLLTVGVGLGRLAETIASEQGPADKGAFILAALWLQQLLTAFVAIVGVGWLTRRTLSGTLQRLRMVVPTVEQIGTGIGVGFAMLVLTVILQFLSVDILGIEVNQDVQALSEQLLGSLFTTPFGVLTLGLAAAIGEEPLFRGALQPRFGIILTSLLFAAVHGNYGLSLSTLIVFVLGLVLGWVRNRHNTTTTMIAHAVYNSSIGLIGYLSIQNLDV